MLSNSASVLFSKLHYSPWSLVTTALKLCNYAKIINLHYSILYTEPAPIVHQADVVTSDNPACSKVGQGVLQEVSVQFFKVIRCGKKVPSTVVLSY